MKSAKAFAKYLAGMAAIEAELPPANTVTTGQRTFRPPNPPVLVKCMHCGTAYTSDKMVWEYRLKFQYGAVECWKRGEAITLEPLWWCAEANCDGAGFGFDIFEVKP